MRFQMRINVHRVTVVVAVNVWGSKWRGMNIQIFVDNMTTVLAINSGASRNDFISACLRELWFWCAKFEILLRAQHLPGVDNRLADYLSRWHLRPEFYSHKFFSELNYDIEEVFLEEANFSLDTIWL